MSAVAEAPAGDILGAAINEGLDELATEAGIPGGEETTETPEEDGVIDGTSDYAPPEEAPVETTEEAPAAPAQSDGPYPLSTDGNGYVLPKQDFQTLEGQRQYAEAVQNRFPTASDAEIAYQESSDFRSMLADYVHGDTNGIDSILAHFAGAGENDPTTSQQFQRSFTTLAQRMPETLKQVNPQAYQQFKEDIFSQEIQEAYDHAAKTGDEMDLFRAQQLDHNRTGQYKSKDQLPKYDAEAVARKEFEDKQALLAAREAQIMDREWKTFDKTTISGPKWNEYWGEIDRTLEPIKGNYSEQHFAVLKKMVSDGVLGKLQEDTQWAANHNMTLKSLQSAFETALRNNQPVAALQQRIQFFKNDFMLRARKYLPSAAKEAVGDPPVATAPKTAATKPQGSPRANAQAAPARPAQPRQPAATSNRPAQQQPFNESPAWKGAFTFKV